MADLHLFSREPRLGLQALRVWQSRVGLAGDEVHGATRRDVDGLPLTAAVALHAAARDVVTLGLVDAIVEGDRIEPSAPVVTCGWESQLAQSTARKVMSWLATAAVRVVHVAAYDVAAASRLRIRGLRRRRRLRWIRRPGS